MGGIYLFIFTFILYFLTIVPLTTFLHELGHLCIAQLLAVKKLRLSIGSGPILFHLKLHDFQIRLHLFFFMGGHATTDDVECLESWKKALIALGGPLLSGIIFIGLVFNGFGTGNHTITIWFQWFALYNLWVCVMNLIPYIKNHKHSDGYVIYIALKEIMTKKTK